MMVLPLEGGSPSSVLVIVFDDAVMLIYGEADEEYLTVAKGNFERFGFDKNPALREIVNEDGTLHLFKLAAIAPIGKRI
jgi:hypothetical protein